MVTALVATITVVPEGPLHPSLAVVALVAGLAGALVAGRDAGRWLVLEIPLVVALVTAAQGPVLRDGIIDHPRRTTVVTALIVVGMVGAVIRPRWSTAVVVAVAGCAGIWAIVPDTEAPLIVGAGLAGGAALRLLPGWIPDSRRRSHAWLLLLPVVAAAAGSLGRPARFGPALVVGALTAFAAVVVVRLCVMRLFGALRRRQRAGTPTTVAPASTSSTTTAPAPTTAF